MVMMMTRDRLERNIVRFKDSADRIPDRHKTSGELVENSSCPFAEVVGDYGKFAQFELGELDIEDARSRN